MKTNRRSFIKNVSCLLGGALASISGFVSAALPGAVVPKAKAEEPETIEMDYPYKLVVATYNGKGNSDGIDIYPKRIGTENSWNDLGCKNCFRECGQWDICLATLKERVEAREKAKDEISPHYFMDSRQQHLIGTCLVTSEGLHFRYVRLSIGTELLGRKTTRPLWCWIPEDRFLANPPQEYLDKLKSWCQVS